VIETEVEAPMRNLIFKTVVATTFLVSASAAHAEIGGGPSPGGLAGPSFGARPNDMVPMPQTPTQQWVPPQHEYDPAIGRDIYVPPTTRTERPTGALFTRP
jgi:hypothetical protein